MRKHIKNVLPAAGSFLLLFMIGIQSVYAQGEFPREDPGPVGPTTGLFGKIKPPPGVEGFAGGALAGLGPFLSVVLRLLVIVAGIYALLNFIFAGYQFMTAGGDPKGVQAAWGRIWQTLVGMIIVVSSFLLAAILGFLLFGDTGAILSPELITP